LIVIVFQYFNYEEIQRYEYHKNTAGVFDTKTGTMYMVERKVDFINRTIEKDTMDLVD
jgi:hypothetical protein